MASVGLPVRRTPAAKYSLGWAYVARNNGNTPLKHGTSYNFGIMAVLKTWSNAPTPSMDGTVTVQSASVRALLTCPRQSVPARVDKAN